MKLRTCIAKDGEKDEIPEDDEIPDDDEIDDEEDRRFGLQFEQVVPDAVYSATAEDGMLTASTSSDRTLTSDELEEQIADRWWSQAWFMVRHVAMVLFHQRLPPKPSTFSSL